ncbi:uncharacterized protein [Bos indicus]|uniref:Uncharacterized protein isoform X2 n=1 Tax=Bos indicus TaxID=9915 RepID=A0ABM4RUM9_BOSIN
MQQELDRSITRELREAAAEFESESYGLSPLGATDGSNLSQDMLLKTSQEYVQILKKKTALHLDCANGHSAVVTLLRERKCRLNLCDNENRTALMKTGHRMPRRGVCDSSAGAWCRPKCHGRLWEHHSPLHCLLPEYITRSKAAFLRHQYRSQEQVDESSEEDSSRRFPNKPDVDLGPTSNDEVLDFNTKTASDYITSS